MGACIEGEVDPRVYAAGAVTIDTQPGDELAQAMRRSIELGAPISTRVVRHVRCRPHHWDVVRINAPTGVPGIEWTIVSGLRALPGTRIVHLAIGGTHYPEGLDPSRVWFTHGLQMTFEVTVTADGATDGVGATDGGIEFVGTWTEVPASAAAHGAVHEDDLVRYQHGLVGYYRERPPAIK
jgi:hypothetical protein